MKILYVLPTAKPGGAAQSLNVLLHEWRKPENGVRPVVALPRDGVVFEELQAGGWRVFELPSGVLRHPHGMKEMGQALSKVLLQQRVLREIIQREKIDIVHANATAAHLAGGLAARRSGIPAVWHVRDLSPLGRWCKNLARRADAVVAISHAVAEALVNQRVPASKIQVVYNALASADWPVQTAPDPVLRRALGATEASVVFGCVGQLVPWKNQAAFIEAAALLRRLEPAADIRFAVVGSDPWQNDSHYRRRLMQQAQTLGLGKELIFFPHQADNKTMLAACDVLVHAALREPFGRVVIEAMALQKPVVAFDAAGPGEIVTHLKDGLLASPASSSAGLAVEMRKVLLSPSLRHELGVNARRTVGERFEASSCAARIKTIYEKVGRGKT